MTSLNGAGLLRLASPRDQLYLPCLRRRHGRECCNHLRQLSPAPILKVSSSYFTRIGDTVDALLVISRRSPRAARAFA